MKAAKVGLLMAALLVLATNAHADLITNGSFEVGGFAGWTNSDPGDGNHMHLECGGGASDGNCHLNYGPVGTLETLSQEIVTTPGTLYQIEFDYDLSGGAPSQFRVNWDGVTIFDLVDGAETGGYVRGVLQAVATDASTTLEFGFRDDPSHSNFDNVTVNAVPEPVSLSLLGLGLAGLAVRRQRNA